MKRHIAVSLLFCAVALVEGCATPAITENMVPPAPVAAGRSFFRRKQDSPNLE